MKNNKSQWQDTKTFFPLFLHEVQRNKRHSVCIIGAADGKFVIPLAESGYHVEAIDIDEVALFGGKVEYPKGTTFTMKGLHERLTERELNRFVKVRTADFTRPETIVRTHDAVFTSCSWHYSRNHSFSLEDYVEKMKSMLIQDGIFCAEYMMPLEAKHFKTNHYVQSGELAHLFPTSEWEHCDDFYTEPFVEAPHVGNLEPHVHRMGFFMARRK